MTDSALALTTDEVASVAQALTDAAALERFVAQLPADRVPLYLARLLDASANIRAVVRGFEQRLEVDGLTGAHFTVDGREYGFYGSLQKGYRDFPGLVRFLIEDCGIPPVVIAEAVSDARVTDLREAASALSDPDKREAALAEIEDHRVAKGERGTPRFQLIDERYLPQPKRK